MENKSARRLHPERLLSNRKGKKSYQNGLFAPLSVGKTAQKWL
ncbi:hypothetical protein [Plesiomonas shigelloides]